jgi:ferrochelatase
LIGIMAASGPSASTGVLLFNLGGSDRLDAMARLAAEGVREPLVVPLSFVSDHIETLYEVDMLFADEAQRCGITGYRRSAALGTHPLFSEALARLVEHHVETEP